MHSQASFLTTKTKYRSNQTHSRLWWNLDKRRKAVHRQISPASVDVLDGWLLDVEVVSPTVVDGAMEELPAVDSVETLALRVELALEVSITVEFIVSIEKSDIVVAR